MFDYLQHRDFQLDEDRAKVLVSKLIDAVRYLHSYGIVHRDLKLENIMMTDNTDYAEPKIIDFGLARAIMPGELCDEPFGTLGYVAPEVLKRESYAFSSDIWSLGCTAYALLCGCLPFDHPTSEQTVKATLKGILHFD